MTTADATNNMMRQALSLGANAIVQVFVGSVRWGGGGGGMCFKIFKEGVRWRENGREREDGGTNEMNSARGKHVLSETRAGGRARTLCSLSFSYFPFS